jgi:hypothetical protein
MLTGVAITGDENVVKKKAGKIRKTLTLILLTWRIW